MLNRRTMLAVSLLAIAPGIALAQAPTTGDPLPSWSDSPVRHSIIDFVTRVTTDGSPDFVPPVNQRWVADMGLPGPDAGKGGKHLLLRRTTKASATSGYYVHRASSNRQIIGARSLPVTWRRRRRQRATEDDQGVPAESDAGLERAAVARRHRQAAGHHARGMGRQIAFWEMLHKTRPDRAAYTPATTTIMASSPRSASRRGNRSRRTRGEGILGDAPVWQRADARAIVWRSPSRSAPVEGPSVAMGEPSLRGRRLQHARSPRHRGRDRTALGAAGPWRQQLC